LPVPVVDFGGAILVNNTRYVVVPNPSEPSGDPMLVSVDLPITPGLYSASNARGETVLLMLDSYGKWTSPDLIASRSGAMTPDGMKQLHNFVALYLDPRAGVRA
jgi:hypothetical protein